LYYLGVLQWVIRGAGLVLETLTGISKVESFVAAANVFFGPVNEHVHD
jgi:nucleoside permease NupC